MVFIEIVLLTEDKLKISLNQKDAEEFGLGCDSLDYKSPKTKRALFLLLERAKAEAGFSPRGAKLYIEVYEDGEGGKTLYFTSIKKPVKISGNQSAISPTVFEFKSADDLIDGACKAFSRYSHRIYKSSLYLIKGKYRLLVYNLDYSDKLSVRFLSEYGISLGEDEILAAYTEEQGEELIADTALDTLARYFGRT